jgi:C_GCAxxG_C_C family probable redox protein
MSNAELAVQVFDGGCNCAQAVLSAYAGELEKKHALSVAAGFGAGMGRRQDVCGAVSGAIMVLGLRSGFKEGDGRDKINAVYTQVDRFAAEFEKQQGTIKCRELLSGCNLSTEAGRQFFKEHNLRDKCRGFIRLACRLLEEQFLTVCSVPSVQ